jgi:hypothetical protein
MMLAFFLFNMEADVVKKLIQEKWKTSPMIARIAKPAGRKIACESLPPDREKTIWSGMNTIFSNPLKRLVFPEYYKLTSHRVYKSASAYFHHGTMLEVIDLSAIDRVETWQHPIHKILGINVGDIHIKAEIRSMVWHSVTRYRLVADLIQVAARELTRTFRPRW